MITTEGGVTQPPLFAFEVTKDLKSPSLKRKSTTSLDLPAGEVVGVVDVEGDKEEVERPRKKLKGAEEEGEDVIM